MKAQVIQARTRDEAIAQRARGMYKCSICHRIGIYCGRGTPSSSKHLMCTRCLEEWMARQPPDTLVSLDSV